ncbi:hypothetical protein [Methanocella sp. MCL-LM]|uniref:hypothetical protein n=1 Tax=Methanocella sp. MCL-LM TaxID=3412035 RepID=UPI003C76822D
MIESDHRYDVRCLICSITLAENVPFSKAKEVYFEHEKQHPGKCVRCYPRESIPSGGKSKGVA